MKSTCRKGLVATRSSYLLRNAQKTNDLSSKEHEWYNNNYSHYISQRNQYINFSFETSKQVDHTLLTLSGVALTFSISFANYIVRGAPISINVLAAAWLFFGVTIISTLLSLKLSQLTISNLIKEMDKQQSSCEKPPSVEVSRCILTSKRLGLVTKISNFV